MEIRSLKDTSTNQIYECFMKAFSNYFFPFVDNERLHVDRWMAAGVSLDMSYGVFLEKKLVGFLLQSPQQESIFNLATGVDPLYRGRRLVDLMYEQALKDAKSNGFKRATLEVITKNKAAIRAYKRNGFTICRELASFKGRLPSIEGSRLYHYDVGPLRFTPEMKALMKFPYSIEQSENVLNQNESSFETHELRHQGSLVAYGIFSPSMLTFSQLEAIHPMKEHLVHLLGEMKLSNETIKMNNIDARHVELTQIWTDLGLDNYISQFEMSRDL